MLWITRRSPHAVPGPLAVQRLDVAQIRSLGIATLRDCHGASCERTRVKVAHAASAQELWLLRGEIYQQVACAHCETEAARRINALCPAFEGWLPDRVLRRV